MNTNNNYFGHVATDIITGFTGIITGKTTYITGCDQYLVQPQCKNDHEFLESRWFDENRLTFNESKVNLDLSSKEGPDKAAPIK